MQKDRFKALVQEIPYGKNLPGTKYIHNSVLNDPGFPKELYDYLMYLQGKLRVSGAWNILKLDFYEFQISFLNYPSFALNPHPKLHRSILFDLNTNQLKDQDYTARESPPVLHRKELFVAPDYEYGRGVGYETYRALTEAEEKAGLLDNHSSIGTLKKWEEALEEAGYTIESHTLVKVKKAPAKKTATKKEKLSVVDLEELSKEKKPKKAAKTPAKKKAVKKKE